MFILRIIHHDYNKLIGFMREYPDEGIAIKIILLSIYFLLSSICIYYMLCNTNF